MPDWIRKSGTTAHPLIATLEDAAGPVDLPAGTTVQIRAKLPGAASAKINTAATVVQPDAPVGNVNRGRVSYALTADDLNAPGLYDVDYEATIPSAGVQHYPENGYKTLLVLADADAI